MKLTSHALYWDNGDASPHVSAVFTFDKGTSLDLVVKHLEACGQKTPTSEVLQDAAFAQAAELGVARANLEQAHVSYKELAAEATRLRKDVSDKSAALQEIQGTYIRLVTEIKQVRSDYERVVTELDAARLENISMKREIEAMQPQWDRQQDDLQRVPTNGPVGEDPKTGEYVYEDLPTQIVHDPVDVQEPDEVEPEKTPKDLFRELFVTECANIKGTSPSEVLDQAYAVFTNRREEATAHGLQRELGTALTMAIADNLNKEPDDARALFSVKLDSVKGKAEVAKAEEDKANEPEVLTRFKTAMDSAPVKAKNSPRQKTVAALALACSKDGKVKLSDMQAAAEVLRKSTGNADDWDALLNKGEKPKSMLETLYKIVSTSLELTVV